MILTDQRRDARIESFLTYMRRSHKTQVPHLRDWIMVNRTCRRFRNVGVEAFFSQKRFVMRPIFMDNLLDLKVKVFSKPDQLLATRYIRTIVIHQHSNRAARNMLDLRRSILEFTRLKRLDYLFDPAPKYWESDVILSKLHGAKEWRKWPAEFIEALRSAGFPVDRLQMEIRADTDAMRILREDVYPRLRRAKVPWSKRKRPGLKQSKRGIE